jgi:ArsR family metal-binding transcriptional regulator
MTTQPYLHNISLTHITPCLAEPGLFIVTGKPSRPLDEVLPYLAALPNVIGFNPETLSLTFRRPRGFMTLYANRVSITQVRDAEEGLELFASLTAAINATWENRAALKPVQTRKKPPGHLDIYALLPQTNCKQCGEATCLAFAVALITLGRTLTECTPLQTEPTYQERKTALEAIL